MRKQKSRNIHNKKAVRIRFSTKKPRRNPAEQRKRGEYLEIAIHERRAKLAQQQRLKGSWLNEERKNAAHKLMRCQLFLFRRNFGAGSVDRVRAQSSRRNKANSDARRCSIPRQDV